MLLNVLFYLVWVNGILNKDNIGYYKCWKGFVEMAHIMTEKHAVNGLGFDPDEEKLKKNEIIYGEKYAL